MTCYTAIFGAYDELKEPIVITPGWSYVCFTDQDFVSNVWEVIKAPVMECGPQKTARFYKIMFHEHISDRFSIWVDGTFIINCDLNEWWKKFSPPFTTIKHPFDKCVYKEIQSCQRGGKGNYSQLEGQRKLYRCLGVPKNNGLIASGILMREKTPEVIEFCKKWWKNLYMWSARDQISFALTQFKMPNAHVSIDWNYTTQDEFIHIPHLNKKWREGKLNQVIQKYGTTKSNQRR